MVTLMWSSSQTTLSQSACSPMSGLPARFGRALGLTIPEPAILYVPANLVESSPSLVIRLSSSTLKCSYGLAFGSRFISDGQVFDYLPDSALSQVENGREFAGV